MENDLFIRNCPSCNKIIQYKNKKSVVNANLNGSLCSSCSKSGKNNHMFGKAGPLNPMFGRKHSNKTKEKIRRKATGRKASKETKQKLSDIRRGKGHPNFGKHLSKKTRDKISAAHTGKKLSDKTKEKISNSLKGEKSPCFGKIASLETRKLISAARQRISIEEWDGFTTPLNDNIRHCEKYYEWRDFCFERDNYSCKNCGDNTGGNLRCHHIIYYSTIIQKYNISSLDEALECKELWDINNGETLCEPCHILRHKKKGN